jgi:hypothetical protein
VEPSFGIGVVCLAADAGVLPKWRIFAESGAAAKEFHEVLRFGEPLLWWDFQPVCSATTPA